MEIEEVSRGREGREDGVTHTFFWGVNDLEDSKPVSIVDITFSKPSIIKVFFPVPPSSSSTPSLVVESDIFNITKHQNQSKTPENVVSSGEQQIGVDHKDRSKNVPVQTQQ